MPLKDLSEGFHCTDASESIEPIYSLLIPEAVNRTDFFLLDSLC